VEESELPPDERLEEEIARSGIEELLFGALLYNIVSDFRSDWSDPRRKHIPSRQP
jgi:hypothetical protein